MRIILQNLKTTIDEGPQAAVDAAKRELKLSNSDIHGIGLFKTSVDEINGCLVEMFGQILGETNTHSVGLPSQNNDICLFHNQKFLSGVIIVLYNKIPHMSRAGDAT